MNPISALQFSVSPEVRAGRLKAGENPAAQAIPKAELESVAGSTGTTPTAGAQGNSFASTLGQFVADVNGRQLAANDAVAGMLSGDNVSLHQAMIAMEEASVSFQLMVEVRNKLLDSYQELMRMQI
jgi:flagellar hook-basal body complex protein FliE